MFITAIFLLKQPRDHLVPKNLSGYDVLFKCFHVSSAVILVGYINLLIFRNNVHLKRLPSVVAIKSNCDNSIYLID